CPGGGGHGGQLLAVGAEEGPAAAEVAAAVQRGADQAHRLHVAVGVVRPDQGPGADVQSGAGSARAGGGHVEAAGVGGQIQGRGEVRLVGGGGGESGEYGAGGEAHRRHGPGLGRARHRQEVAAHEQLVAAVAGDVERPDPVVGGGGEGGVDRSAVAGQFGDVRVGRRRAEARPGHRREIPRGVQGGGGGAVGQGIDLAADRRRRPRGHDSAGDVDGGQAGPGHGPVVDDRAEGTTEVERRPPVGGQGEHRAVRADTVGEVGGAGGSREHGDVLGGV